MAGLTKPSVLLPRKVCFAKQENRIDAPAQLNQIHEGLKCFPEIEICDLPAHRSNLTPNGTKVVFAVGDMVSSALPVLVRLFLGVG